MGEEKPDPKHHLKSDPAFIHLFFSVKLINHIGQVQNVISR